jgi:hypothetical protein
MGVGLATAKTDKCPCLETIYNELFPGFLVKARIVNQLKAACRPLPAVRRANFLVWDGG